MSGIHDQWVNQKQVDVAGVTHVERTGIGVMDRRLAWTRWKNCVAADGIIRPVLGVVNSVGICCKVIGVDHDSNLFGYVMP